MLTDRFGVSPSLILADHSLVGSEVESFDFTSCEIWDCNPLKRKPETILGSNSYRHWWIVRVRVWYEVNHRLIKKCYTEYSAFIIMRNESSVIKVLKTLRKKTSERWSRILVPNQEPAITATSMPAMSGR